VLGGFSMGSAMSFALGLGGDRPVPAGILAFSGFIPSVPGWEPDLASRTGLPVFIAHGSGDPVIDVAFARRAHDGLTAGGLEVDYHESGGVHEIEARNAGAAAEWLRQTFARNS
jgi:phospholipase/carboxylesterase